MISIRKNQCWQFGNNVYRRVWIDEVNTTVNTVISTNHRGEQKVMVLLDFLLKAHQVDSSIIEVDQCWQCEDNIDGRMWVRGIDGERVFVADNNGHLSEFTRDYMLMEWHQVRYNS